MCWKILKIFEFFFFPSLDLDPKKKNENIKINSPQGDTLGLIPPVPSASATIESVNSTECRCEEETGGGTEVDLFLPRGPRSAACTVRSTSPAVNTAEETRIVKGLPTEAQSARAPPTSGEMYWRPCGCFVFGVFGLVFEG